jgi:hypothetical protein
MKKLLALFSIFFALAATAQKANLITTQSFDKITKTSSYNDLKKLYGAANVKDDDDYGAEGMDTTRVTKIFKDKKNEIVVYWDEKSFHKKIAAVECYQEGAPYYTADSIKLGATLKKLLEVNGKKINFSGMGWDYGGAIISFNKGKLAKSVITYSLGSTDGMSTKLDGDVQLNTDMPIVKKNLTKVKVVKIAVDFIVNK